MKLIEAIEALKAEIDIPPTIKEILQKTKGCKQVGVGVGVGPFVLVDAIHMHQDESALHHARVSYIDDP